MTPELKTTWLKDMRDHPELKGMGRLREHEGPLCPRYCCMGRLLVVAGREDAIEDLQDMGMEELNASLLAEFGLDVSHQATLIDINDDGPAGAGAEDDWHSVIAWIETEL